MASIPMDRKGLGGLITMNDGVEGSTIRLEWRVAKFFHNGPLHLSTLATAPAVVIGSLHRMDGRQEPEEQGIWARHVSKGAMEEP
jgi:hypothetical protein